MRKGTCVYFTGLRDEECEKGVNYRSTAPGAKFGWATRIPCMSENSSTCEYYKDPTDQEIAEHEESVKRSTKGMVKAIAIIREKTKAEPDFNPLMGNKKGTNGFIDCPICKSPLHYSVSARNNHVHGQCSKDGCLAWMM